MTHDPLCLMSVDDEAYCCPDCEGYGCECDLIAKVRTDERSRCIAEVEALGPLQQFKGRKGEDGYLVEGYEIVDVADALRSQP